MVMWMMKKLRPVAGISAVSMLVLLTWVVHQDPSDHNHNEGRNSTIKRELSIDLLFGYGRYLRQNSTDLRSDVYSTPVTTTGGSMTVSVLGGYHLLTMVSLFNGNASRGYENFTSEELGGRDGEYLETLKKNLNHDQVVAVHLFYINDDDLKTVKALNSSNTDKMYPVRWHRKLHMADFFLYASRYLVDKPVIALNSDIIIGEGLNEIDTERLRDERVMYSLTRHNIIRGNETCTPVNMCTEYRYIGSHDTHIFRLAEPLNETLILDKLDYPINMWGAENAMHWTFKFSLGFVVRNPCRVVYTYHNHCSKVHGPSLEQVKEHKYSIFFLPDKGWAVEHVRASFSPFEDALSYRESVNSTISPTENLRNSTEKSTTASP